MALAVASILFLLYVANVILGAFSGAPILGNVGEMLILFCASIAFVAAILRREARDRRTKNH